MQSIAPMLWFNGNADEALKFYTSVFKNSKVNSEARYPKGAPMPEGTLMTASITLNGQEFVLLNAGSDFSFTEAVSFVISCNSQDEVDHYWNSLTADGGEESMCGWLKDKFGLSWQVTPKRLIELTTSKDKETAQKAMQAMMTMRKIDIAALEKAVNS